MAVGIYHQVDLEIMDAAAALRAKGVDSSEANRHLASLAIKLGISEKTIMKRTRPARAAWLEQQSILIEDAGRLLPQASDDDRVCIHLAVLAAGHPFFLDVLSQIGTAVRLGSEIRQATIRDRISREHGHTESVHQGVQKSIQTLVAWGLLQKTPQTGVYTAPAQRRITRSAAEVLLASILTSLKRGAMPMSRLVEHSAAFAFIMPTGAARDGKLLRTFTEGRELYVELVT